MIKINNKKFFCFRNSEYYCSADGEIARIKLEGSKIIFFQILKKNINKRNYERIQLMNRTKFSVHRIVAEIFNKDFYKGCIINHLDNNPLNNHKDNLQVTDQKGNIKHCIEQDRFKNVTVKIIIRCKNTNNIFEFKRFKELYIFLNSKRNPTAGSKIFKTKRFYLNYDLIKGPKT